MVDDADNAANAKPRRRKRGEGEDRKTDWKHLSRLFEQLPPHALEAEMSLLGSMLIEPQVIGDILLVVKSGDDFFKPAHGAIYGTMIELYERQNALDIVQLNQLLADRNVLEAVGGVEYLVELANAVPTAANALHYARLVREKAIIRSLINAAGEVLYDAYHSPEKAAEILGAAEQKIFRIAQQSEQTHAESMQELVQQVMATIEENDGRLITGVPSGFAEMDEMTHGCQPGEMLIIAARPSMGKTAFALNVAEQMAMAGYPVAIFSLEMSKAQLVQRLLSSRSGVNSQKIRRNMLGHEDWDRLRQACAELYEAQMFIDDTPGLSLLQMRAKARRLKARNDIKAIVIDYLQLMTSGQRAESRQIEIGEISRGVKAMARELDVPVLCLSQLNRAAENREGHRPRMSDLRESGSIEQDADVIMMLHREEYYHVQDPEWAELNPDKVGLAELIIAKQRNGPTGTVRLSWIANTTRFRDHSPATPPGGYYEPTTIPEAPPNAAPEIETGLGHFTPGRSTGPVENFRDGGGPIDGGDVDGIPL